MENFERKTSPKNGIDTENWFIESYRRYKGHPIRILIALYKGNYHKFVMAVICFFIKHACVWVLPIITANIINDVEMEDDYGILRHEEGIDLMPGNIELSGLEVSLVNVMSRELVMRSYIEQVKERYDYILIDNMPSLGMLTVNALAAADSVIIPVMAHYLPVKGLEQLMQTIYKVRKQINRKLQIDGILLTMVDRRTNFSKEIIELLHDNYGEYINIFKTAIPFSIRAAETSAEGVSIYKHDPKGRVAEAYKKLVEEVIGDGSERK